MSYIYCSCYLYRSAPLNPCSTYTALVVCTGRHHLIHVVHILLLSFVQDGTIESMWYIYSSCCLYRTTPLNPCSTYTALVVCTGRHQWIHVVQYVPHGFNGAVLYKRQELYMYYMDSMVPSCTNNKSCICTTWIQWRRPVQMTRTVYVPHGLNGAVL
jgi:hypothetical protein